MRRLTLLLAALLLAGCGGYPPITHEDVHGDVPFHERYADEAWQTAVPIGGITRW